VYIKFSIEKLYVISGSRGR